MTAQSPTGASAQPRARRRGIVQWLLLALLLLPFIEIAVLILVGRLIGVWWTLALIVGVAVAGAWLARRETGRTYRALQKAFSSGTMPADEATDAILIMVGGFLLILPGFVGDLLGLILVLPFTRPLARRLLHLVITRQAMSVLGNGTSAAGATVRRPPPGRPGPGRPGQVIEGEVVSETPAPGQRDAQPQPFLEP